MTIFQFHLSGIFVLLLICKETDLSITILFYRQQVIVQRYQI